MIRWVLLAPGSRGRAGWGREHPRACSRAKSAASNPRVCPAGGQGAALHPAKTSPLANVPEHLLGKGEGQQGWGSFCRPAHLAKLSEIFHSYPGLT